MVPEKNCGPFGLKPHVNIHLKRQLWLGKPMHKPHIESPAKEAGMTVGMLMVRQLVL